MLCDVRDRVPGQAERGGSAPIFICPSLLRAAYAFGTMAVDPAHPRCECLCRRTIGFGRTDLRGDRLYFGVSALDRLRSPDRLLGRLRAKGISRIANLPTVAFFDATTRANLAALDFSPELELAFLLRARRAGFGVAFCTGQESTVAPAERRELDFLILHDRPGTKLRVIPA